MRILDGAREELAAALDDLRELARGIHPAVLTDRGLEAAVEALATRSPVPVEFETPVEQLPRAVEAAAYYVIAESLTNVTSTRAQPRQRARRPRERQGDRDGLRRRRRRRRSGSGSGLRGLADRVEALDGTLVVDSPPHGGTCVTAVIPLQTDQAR